MLVCPFTIEEVLTGKSFKMQYRVGFVGCDQNENKEVFPVMGWFVEPYKEPKPRYWWFNFLNFFEKNHLDYETSNN